jgi:hypothetical protein
MKRTAQFIAMMFVAAIGLIACDTTPAQLSSEEREALQFANGAAALEACRATQCERLDLDGNKLTDFSVLNDMYFVKALMVSRTNFVDLGEIAGMTQLQELHISHTDIETLDGLAVFSNLDVLHMEGLRAKPSLAPLASPSLRGLVELALTTEKEDSIAFIAGMKSLKRLKFGYGEIGDARPLDGHPSLERIASDADILQWQRGLLRIPRLKEFFVGNGMRNLDDGIRDALDERGLLATAPPIIVC